MKQGGHLETAMSHGHGRPRFKKNNHNLRKARGPAKPTRRAGKGRDVYWKLETTGTPRRKDKD